MRVSPCRTAARTSETRPEIAFCQTNPFLAPTRTKETTCTHPRRSHLPPRPVTRNPLPIHRFSWWSSLRSLLLCAKHSSSSPHPMPPFEFATAARILFGEGDPPPGPAARSPSGGGPLRRAPAAAASLGRRALLVTGASPDRAAPLQKALQAAHVSTVPFAVPGEPTPDLIRPAPRDCDFVIAFGGGSALDAAKALAALFTNHGDPLDYLEVIGLGHPLTLPAAPCIAIPTTAGTGSEVTRNAVLASPLHRVKASLRSASM